MKLYLVRHGESEGNFKKIYCGHTDVELTQKGLEQAQNMAKIFKDIDINKIYASPLQRAYNTALEISKIKNIPIIKNDLLKERYFGVFEGLNWDEIEKKYPEEAKKSIEQDIRYEYKDGETFDEIFDRASRFLDIVADNSVVVAHGFLLRTMLCRLGFVDRDNLFDYYMHNCDVLYIDGNKIEYINK